MHSFVFCFVLRFVFNLNLDATWMPLAFFAKNTSALGCHLEAIGVHLEAIWRPLGAQVGPRDAQKRPKSAQVEPKRRPRRAQELRVEPKKRPRVSKLSPRGAQVRPSAAQMRPCKLQVEVESLQAKLLRGELSSGPPAELCSSLTPDSDSTSMASASTRDCRSSTWLLCASTNVRTALFVDSNALTRAENCAGSAVPGAPCGTVNGPIIARTRWRTALEPQSQLMPID